MKKDYGAEEFTRIRKEGIERYGWDVCATQLRNEISIILADVKDATFKEIWPKVKHIAKQYNIAEEGFKITVSRTLTNMKRGGQIESTICKRPKKVKGFKKVI